MFGTSGTAEVIASTVAPSLQPPTTTTAGLPPPPVTTTPITAVASACSSTMAFTTQTVRILRILPHFKTPQTVYRNIYFDEIQNSNYQKTI